MTQEWGGEPAKLVEGLMPPRREKNETVLRARALRRNMTLPEGLLWQVLRTRPHAFKFRRQHPIGQYIADFYCPAAKLVIEVDGIIHGMADRPVRDQRRDQWLRSKASPFCESRLKTSWAIWMWW
jgi:very-short-patch-repair endonuclease